MVEINASAVMAHMVNVDAFGYIAMFFDPCGSMGVHCLATKPSFSIAEMADIPWPFNAILH